MQILDKDWKKYFRGEIIIRDLEKNREDHHFANWLGIIDMTCEKVGIWKISPRLNKTYEPSLDYILGNVFEHLDINNYIDLMKLDDTYHGYNEEDCHICDSTLLFLRIQSVLEYFNKNNFKSVRYEELMKLTNDFRLPISLMIYTDDLLMNKDGSFYLNDEVKKLLLRSRFRVIK